MRVAGDVNGLNFKCYESLKRTLGLVRAGKMTNFASSDWIRLAEAGFQGQKSVNGHLALIRHK